MVELDKHEQARLNKAIAVTDAQIKAAIELLRENKIAQDYQSILTIVNALATNYNATVIAAQG